MSLKCVCLVLSLTAGLVLPCAVFAQAPKSYTDYRKVEVTLPLGAISFADRVVSFERGERSPRKTEADPANAIGEPDYRKSGDGKAFTLGCRGSAIFEFTDNALVDGPGTDLYVFEVGADVEPTDIALSNDGVTWTNAGRIAGGKTGLDLAEAGHRGQSYRFVRLTDTGKSCSGDWPGADIDAIAAVGSAIRYQLSGAVLFDFDRHDLRPGAHGALADLVAKLSAYPAARITVAGHTDAKGSDAYNQSLSEKRAGSVAAYLRAHVSGSAVTIDAVGMGETEPVADNATEDGRARNRRVEIIVVPNS